MTTCKIFTVDDQNYEIRYNTKRIEMYENVHKPIMVTMAVNSGQFAYAELRDIVGYGLKVEGGNFVNPAQASKIADEIIKEEGYFPMVDEVAEALARDCGFFLKGSSVG